jgi:hypothetical protein
MSGFYRDMSEVSRLLSDANFPNDARSITALTAVALMALIAVAGDAKVAEHLVSDMFEMLKGVPQLVPDASDTLH